MKLPILLLFIIVLMQATNAYSQVDKKDSFIVVCAKKWHIKGNALVVGYGIQSQPFIKDSLTIYVRFGNDYTQYAFTGCFMDSLMKKGRYLTDENLPMRKIINNHKILFPLPPSSQ